MADGSSSLSAWPMAASFLDAWIWAGRLRFGLMIFFQKMIFGCWSATIDTSYQRVTFCISEVVSVGSTNTYNFLPTDTKNCFRSIV
jgi:hypothetical protein